MSGAGSQVSGEKGKTGKKRFWPGLLVGLLLVAGLSVLLYPTVSDRIAARNHSRAIVEYAVTVDELTCQEVEAHFTKARSYNATLTGMVAGDAFDSTEDAFISPEYLSILNVNGMIGYVDIPSIDVHLPLYHTASEPVLRKGVGHMPETAFPVGDAGDHPVLTAHRGLPSARLFTDLNKLEEGDLFQLHILDRLFVYRVDQVLVVEPHDTLALQPLPEEDKVTLVTCTPYAVNSHRLLVRGSRMVETSHQPDEIGPMQEAAVRRFPLGAAIFLPLALALGGSMAYGERRRSKRS